MRLNSAMKVALAAPEVQKNLTALGLAGFQTSPAEFKAFVAAQIRMYAELVKLAKIELQ